MRPLREEKRQNSGCNPALIGDARKVGQPDFALKVDLRSSKGYNTQDPPTAHAYLIRPPSCLQPRGEGPLGRYFGLLDAGG